jgi:hypothetical protein
MIEFVKQIRNNFATSDITFPDLDYTPAEFFECLLILPIPFAIAFNFVPPELASRLRPYRVGAPVMMPETTINQHNCL